MQLYQDFYQGNHLLALPIFALILFMAVFAVATALAWRRPSRYRAAASLPLADDESSPSREAT